MSHEQAHPIQIQIKDKTPSQTRIRVRQIVGSFVAAAVLGTGTVATTEQGRDRIADVAEGTVAFVGGFIPEQQVSPETKQVQATMIDRQIEKEHFEAGEAQRALEAQQANPNMQIENGAVNYDSNTGGPVNP